MSVRKNSEAYVYVHVVAEHDSDGGVRVLYVGQNWVEALKVANEPDHAKARILYGVPVRAFKAHREYVVGHYGALRRLDEKKRSVR